MVHNKLIDYLSKKIKNFRGSNSICVCPKCNKPLAQIRPFLGYSLFCLKCGDLGNIYDIVRLVEEDKKEMSNEEIEEYISNLLNLNIITKKEIDKILNFYKKNNFSLLRIIRNGKIPVEKNWTNIEHRDKEEWKRWLAEKANIGVRTGKVSGITVIDIDSKDLPPIIDSIDTLVQETNKGFHYIFKYDEELPKTRIDELKIDIENDGGQIIVSPSSIDGFVRKINFKDIVEIPIELKEWLLKKMVEPKITKKIETYTELTTDSIGSIEEGNRNSLLIKLGGIFRKQFSTKETTTALSIINNTLCSPKLPQRELYNIIKSLNKYTEIDERETTSKVLEYIKLVGEATSKDIEQALRIEKKEVDKILSYLLKEEYIIKIRRLYKALKKIEWKEEFSNESRLIDYKMPYFYDVAIFRNSDLLIFGSSTKRGKCLAYGYLLTNQGFKKIEHIGKNRKEGINKVSRHLRICSATNKEHSYRNPNYFYKEKVNETIKIETYYGFDLEGTPEHPILVIETIKEKLDKPRKFGKRTIYYKSKRIKKFKQLKDLKEGDEVIIYSPQLFPTAPYISKFNYKKNKHVTNINEINIPKTLDYDFARLLGYIVGDGNLQKNGISIYQDIKYANITKDIADIVKKIGLQPKIKKQKKSNCYRIKINSAILYSFVKEKVFGIKAKKIKNLRLPFRFVPNIILNGSYEVQRGFIEAIFDCESYLSKSGLLSISMANKELIKTLQMMLLNFGIISKFRSKKNKKYNRYYYYLILPVQMTHKFFKIFDTKKYNVNLIKNPQKRIYHIKNLGNNQYKKSKYFIDTIVKKEIIHKEKYVYDFNIENNKYKVNNQFWCNGFVNHNTHIALNLIADFVQQGKKPYYINLEAGNRFSIIALHLGLKEGDFYYATEFDPEEIELEDNAITIIDWLLPKDYSTTDKIFQHFSKQLVKHKGNLIVFVQLRSNGDFFAKDLIGFFPSLVARYFYDDDTGETGYWNVDYIRESKHRYIKEMKIPCKYLWEEKRLIRIDELERGK